MAFCYWWFLTSRISAKRSPIRSLQQSNESWHRRSTNLVTSPKRQWAKQWMPSPVSLERRTLFSDLKNSKNPGKSQKWRFFENLYTRPVCIQVQFLLHLRVQWFLGNFKVHWHSIDPPRWIDPFISNDLLGEKIGWRNFPTCGENSMWPKRLKELILLTTFFLTLKDIISFETRVKGFSLPSIFWVVRSLLLKLTKNGAVLLFFCSSWNRRKTWGSTDVRRGTFAGQPIQSLDPPQKNRCLVHSNKCWKKHFLVVTFFFCMCQV